MIELIPIEKTLAENEIFSQDPNCSEFLKMSVDFYNRVGYKPPWIGYYARKDGKFVGSCGFKGAPKEGKVEIAYGTFEQYRNRGIGQMMCRKLIQLALNSSELVIISARTLPVKNYSTRILEKNGFECQGVVYDEEDGDVWEWIYSEANIK